MKKIILLFVLLVSCTLKAQKLTDVFEYPYSFVCKIMKEDKMHATGFIISENYILTNAHVTVGLSPMVIIPGYQNKGTKYPFGKIEINECVRGVNVFIPDEYVGSKENPTIQHDYSLIKFEAPEVIKKLEAAHGKNRYFKLAVFDDVVENRLNQLITISGYPCWNRLDRILGKKKYFQYTNSGKLRNIYGPEILHYRLNTRGCSSGSPLWIDADAKAKIVIGLHRGGKGFKNSGVEITQRVYNQIKKWELK